MNRTQALAKLKPLLGKNLSYREDPKALTGDERQEAIEESKRIRAAMEQAAEALNARRQAVLAADPEYQALKLAHQEAVKAKDRANSAAFSRRITVGTMANMAGLRCFSVAAEADNWAEAVEAVKAKKGKE